MSQKQHFVIATRAEMRSIEVPTKCRMEIYQSVLTSIHDNIHRYYDRFLLMDDLELQENFSDLCDLVDAIENGSADDARRLAREHVQRFNSYMQRRAQEERADATASPRRRSSAPKGEPRRKR